MGLQPPDLLDKFYPSLDKLVKTLNIFASFQEYTIIKRNTKVSKEEILLKAVLICDRSKKYINKNKNKINTTSQKTNCSYNAIIF